jgi:16S rRNA (uracil1498-N3)-methyltransferase
MAHLYIADGLTQTVAGATITLEGAEARHAASVSRLRVGESVLVSNGAGLLIVAETQSVAKDQIALTVVSVTEVAAQTPAITLIQALAKGDRDERAIEMATELGVTGIVPWQSARSVSRWDGDKAVKGRDRWQVIVREASKQSVRAWVPVVHPVASTKDILGFPIDGLTVVLDPSGESSVSQALSAAPQRAAQGIRVVVGPEGGLSNEEVSAFAETGAVIVGLGTNILRTSTAGPAVIAVINEILARW